MTRNPILPQLNDDQKLKICLYLSTGCDRETAARLTNCSHADIRRQMSRDSAFAVEVRRAEGASELAHVRNLQNAAQDVKNWRASVWWLERRSPERFGRRNAGTVTTRHLEAFVAQLVSAVMDELQDAADRQRLIDRFHQVVRSLDELIFDDAHSSNESRGKGSVNLLEHANQNAANPSDGDTTDLDEELA